ncbi:MAG: hypothetical protein PHQ28_00155 [Mycobacterium sp.]|nr:hypothetical protein [Mycobacterium sp.]
MFLDFDDIDLTDSEGVGVQIVERQAIIDRLTGEVDQLGRALLTTAPRVAVR